MVYGRESCGRPARGGSSLPFWVRVVTVEAGSEVPSHRSRAFTHEADALTEAWRFLRMDRPGRTRLIDLTIQREDGSETGLDELRRWADLHYGQS